MHAFRFGLFHACVSFWPVPCMRFCAKELHPMFVMYAYYGSISSLYCFQTSEVVATSPTLQPMRRRPPLLLSKALSTCAGSQMAIHGGRLLLSRPLACLIRPIAAPSIPMTTYAATVWISAPAGDSVSIFGPLFSRCANVVASMPIGPYFKNIEH